MSESIPDYLNLNKKRTERKRIGRSLEKFSSNNTNSSNITSSHSRTRISSVFKLKLQSLNDARNKKKYSQSMVRSKKFEVGSDKISSHRGESIEKSSSIILKKHRVLKNRFSKAKALSKIEDQKSIQSISKGGIQGIITPVVQISYNQIKSGKDVIGRGSKSSEAAHKPLNSQRGIRLDLLHNFGGKGVRTESEKRKKGSFMSNLETLANKTPKLLSKKPDTHKALFKPNFNLDDNPDDGVDECMPGESTLSNRANSVNESFQMTKRTLSSMQKSCDLKVVVNKPSSKIFNRFKDKVKNSTSTTLNAVKIVSINNLTDSTKSAETSHTKRYFSKKQAISSEGNLKINPTPESGNFKLNSSCNNNSISSLKLNEKNLQIDLGNQTKTDFFYSPLVRDRSHTMIAGKEMIFHKCKSSQSISSTEKGNTGNLKSSQCGLPNTPFRNIKPSMRKYHYKGIPGPLGQECDDFEGAYKSSNRARGSITKEKPSGKAIRQIKNNADVQKVRDAILSSIDNSNTEYGSYERRKLRFLNSIDENKDQDLLKKKFRDSQSKQKDKGLKNTGDLLEKCIAVQNSLNLHLTHKAQSNSEKESDMELRIPTGIRKIGCKADTVQKVQVYLSSHYNINSSTENINNKKESNNTEAMKPLSIKPKEHASLFKSKYNLSCKQGYKRTEYNSTEKKKLFDPSKAKGRPKKLERYLRPSGL
ncbi:unnamed protein product [Moneuplotes crassus]|uniref:Uncharacterized protein n=1 Tax=Euplotes crassus TaxID=5936 RepID=A0AAD1X3B7_EUPCR|nr:unnamed protein product [Moneuplotes crassus]